MTAIWIYPWIDSRAGVASTFDALSAAGVTRLAVAAHYHSVRTFGPTGGGFGFETFPGGALFEPDPSQFDGLTPPTTGKSGSFDRFVAAATDRGFDVDAWVVCNHGSRLADQYPQYRIRTAFGEADTHALCPSNPAVRDYLANVVGAVADRGVDRIDLESLGFPSVFHGHGPSVGHHKDHVVTDRAGEFLVSQCFCDGCRRSASGVVDLDAAAETVRDLCREYLSRPDAELPPLTELVEADPVLEDLFAFRERVVASLLGSLSDAAGGTPLCYYLADGGAYIPDNMWPSGVTPDLIDRYVDEVAALCYVGDGSSVERRLERASALRADLHAGLTFDPGTIEDRAHLHRIASTAREHVDGDLIVYNYNLLTERHLEWIGALGGND